MALSYHEGVKFEIEIKLRLPDTITQVRRTLREKGFRVAKRRVLETNVLFDSPDQSLGQQDKLIRIRRVGRYGQLTYKGPSKQSRYKKRPEIEIDLSDATGLEKILEQVGFDPVFRYEKFRTVYSKPPAGGKVMLDETPIGNFLEIEGSPAWIDRTARVLGHSSAEYITRSYGYLFWAYCQEQGIHAKDMLFGAVEIGRTPDGRRRKES